MKIPSSRPSFTALAIDGGQPECATPPPPWPYYGSDEVEAAATVLRSGRVNYWTGEEARKFEHEYAVSVGVEHAVALMNGTVALEAALYALGIGPGDEVIVPCRTFIATASAVVMRGAIPIMADIDPDSQNLTVATIEPLITRRTRAVIAVHLAGWPCEMDPLLALAAQHNFYVIEDCAQAHGATYKGRPVGSFGHAAAFSFCQEKIITTGGEGGMLTTNDRSIWERAWSFKDHGKGWDTVYNRQHSDGFRWLHDSFGTNWRLTEMQAAIGRIQLRRLPAWVKQRRENARVLEQGFSRIRSLRTTRPQDDFGHSYYKYYVFVRPECLAPRWTRDRIVQAIQAEGIPCMTGVCPEIYLEEAFQSAGWHPVSRLPVAKELGETSVMFLVHPTLQTEHMLQTCRAVEKVMSTASI